MTDRKNDTRDRGPGKIDQKDARDDLGNREAIADRTLGEVPAMRLPKRLAPCEAEGERNRRIGEIVEREDERRRQADYNHRRYHVTPADRNIGPGPRPGLQSADAADAADARAAIRVVRPPPGGPSPGIHFTDDQAGEIGVRLQIGKR
jgi:hypothetical protein